jgi:RNA polymerase sigma-70 factor (ECF subfamily)
MLSEQFALNGRLFFSLAFGLVRNVEVAEDICQQAMLKALEGQDRPVEQSQLRAWLARVVVNEGLQHCRRAKVENRWMRDSIARGLDGGEPPHDQVDRRDSILSAMGRLPEVQRTIVAMRIMQGTPGKEVAAILGISEVVVSRQLYLGMERLREMLADWKGTTGKQS